MTPPADEPSLALKTEVTGRGAPLVLVPGGLTGWLGWQPHAERLATERQVIRTQLLNVDLGLRGLPLPPGYAVTTESGALDRALSQLGLGEADFAAWSYGAATTLDLALNRPERVRTLTLIEPPAFWVLRGLGRFGSSAQEARSVIRAFGPDEVSEAQLEHFLVASGILPADVDARSLPQWPVWLEHRQSLRIGDTPFRHQDDVARLRTFARPTLLFKGEGSAEHARTTIDLLGQELPHARVEELPGGHALHLISIERFLTIFRAFLDEHGLGP